MRLLPGEPCEEAGPETELGRLGLPALAELVQSGNRSFGGPGGKCSDLGGGARPRSPVGQGIFDLGAARRESRESVLGETRNVGCPFLHRAPGDAEGLRKLVAQCGLVEVTERLGPTEKPLAV